MTIKGFTEHRGTASRMTFDHRTGQFSQTPMPHPFLERMEARVEMERCVVTTSVPKAQDLNAQAFQLPLAE
jgi:hypothetical protein